MKFRRNKTTLEKRSPFNESHRSPTSALLRARTIGIIGTDWVKALMQLTNSRLSLVLKLQTIERHLWTKSSFQDLNFKSQSNTSLITLNLQSKSRKQGVNQLFHKVPSIASSTVRGQAERDQGRRRKQAALTNPEDLSKTMHRQSVFHSIRGQTPPWDTGGIRRPHTRQSIHRSVISRPW